MALGRTAELDKIEGRVEAFAEDWADGASRKKLAADYGVSERTITEYCKRDDVKLHARKFLEDKRLRIRRKSDAKIESALDHLDPTEPDDVKVILAIRKAFAGEGPDDAEKTADELLAEAMDLMDENPEAAARAKELVANESRR
jgi:hypothetical protein